MKNQKELTSPDLPAVFRSLLRAAQLSINCVQIGTIKEFNAENQTATIQISMKMVTSIADDGTKTLNEYPLLLECPVIIMQGGGDHITFPIAEGDNCVVLFNDRQIDQWLNFGDGIEPAVSRVHDISDGMAIVGINPYTKSIENYFTDGIQLKHDNVVIELSDDLIASTALLFSHDGNVGITDDLFVGGNFQIIGTITGNGGDTLDVDSDIIQVSGREIHAGNGANGTFDVVTVVDGIVTGGSAGSGGGGSGGAVDSVNGETGTVVLATGDIAESGDDLYFTSAERATLVSVAATIVTLDAVAFSGDYNDLINAPTIPTVPTATSDLTNDSGFITGYTVTEGDVLAHQAAISITESQISDLGTYLESVDIADINATGAPDATKFLRGDGTWTAPAAAVAPFIHLTPSATQNIGGSNGSIDYISWDTQESIDAATFTHDTATNNTRIEVDETGRYHVKASVSAQQGGSARTTLEIYTRINGVTDYRRGTHRNYSRGANYGDISLHLDTEIELTAGDYIEIATSVDDSDGTYGINTFIDECEVIVRKIG